MVIGVTEILGNIWMDLITSLHRKGDIMRHRINKLVQALIIPVQTRLIIPVQTRSIIPVQTPYRASLLVTILLLLISSCKTMPDIIETDSTNKIDTQSQAVSLSETQKLLVEEANRLIGVEKLFVKNRTFSMDCSGTVMAIYWYAGIDLAEAFPSYSGSGTERIYKYLRDKNLLYRTEVPKPGDIIFWDNTYDKNRNGKPDDYLTHMGMVISVDNAGNIKYIHENYRKGIILAKMNLYKPDVYTEIIDGEKIILNDPMRMKGSVKYSKWLSSQLYNNFAMGYLLK